MAAADIKLISVCLTFVILIEAKVEPVSPFTDDPIELKLCPGESTELQMEHSLGYPPSLPVTGYWYVNDKEQKKTANRFDMIFKFTFKPNKEGVFEIKSKIVDDRSEDEMSTKITTVTVEKAATPVLNVNGYEVNNNTEWNVLHDETIEVGCSASGSETNLNCDGASNVGDNTVTVDNVTVTSDSHQQQCTCVIQQPLVCKYGNEAHLTFNAISPVLTVNGKEVNNNTEWTVLHGETIEVECSASGSYPHDYELNFTCDGVSNVGSNTVTVRNVTVTSDKHQQQCTCVIRFPSIVKYGYKAHFTFNVIFGPVSVTAGPGNILRFFLDPSEPTTLNLQCTHDTTKVVPNATVTLTGIPGVPNTPNVTTTQGSHLISHFTFRPKETGFFTVMCTAVNTENTAFNATDSMIVFVQNSSMKLFDRHFILMMCIAILLTTMNQKYDFL